jgi:hypothetical protein
LTPYEETLLKAEKKNILIDQAWDSKKIPVAGISFDGRVGIFINESAYGTERERRKAFAHEMAHCETNGFYNERTQEKERRRIENRATKRTVTYLVPFNLYKKTILAGCFDEYEQAEEWNIPQEYVCIVHQTYEATRWDEVQTLKASIAERFDY